MPKQKTITVADVEKTLGPVAAKLAVDGHWPDTGEVLRMLEWIEEHGRPKAKRMLNIHRRYRGRARAEQFRAKFGGNGKVA